jgi:hypothetical protein
MTDNEPARRSDQSRLHRLPGDQTLSFNSLREAAESFATKLDTLNSSLAAPPETVEEVRAQLNAVFQLVQAEKFLFLSGRRVSDATEKLLSGWESLSKRYREAREALQRYEAIAGPFAEDLEEAQGLKDRIETTEQGMPFREAALTSSELFYETLALILYGLSQDDGGQA